MINKILNIILKLYNSAKKKQQLKHCSKYIDFNNTVNIDGLKLETRNNSNKKLMKIGDNSMVGAHIVFEKDSGYLNIGERTIIGNSTFICVEGIEIGSDVLISWGCTVVDNNAHSINSSERINDVNDWKRGVDENKGGGFYKDWNNVKKDRIIIKDKVWIGFNCIILRGVTIGEGAVVGAGSVVIKDVPPYTLVMGNPAKPVWKTK